MRYHEGLVIHVGPEVKYVVVGVNIMFDKAQGHHITIDDKTYRIIREQDVAVVL
jgi:co-chaperonin GroES (HSP10)